MRIKGFISYLLLLLFFSSCSIPAAHPVEHQRNIRRVAIRAARLFDVSRGRMINRPVVLVENDKIAAVGPDLPVPPQAQLIDLGDVTLLPGLIDAHTHITYHFDETGHFGLRGDPSNAVALRYAAENARLTLEAGFTTIRNLGAGGLIDINLRDAIKKGEVVGPRMLVSGMPLLPDNVPDAEEAARLSFIRDFVRARIAEGADVIKIFEGVDERGQPYFNENEIRAAVEEAARAGRRVAVHAHEAPAVKAAVLGGCASIEHGSFLDQEAIRLLARHHTALVPTLYLPTHYLEHREQFAFDESTWSFFERLRSHNLDNARRAKEAGVWIVSGSDAVAGLHGQNAHEPEWLVKAGLTPAEAIRAATSDAARLLGWENQVGEIKAGEFADIIAVTGDPSKDIKALQHVEFVMKGGQVFKDNLTKDRAR